MKVWLPGAALLALPLQLHGCRAAGAAGVQRRVQPTMRSSRNHQATRMNSHRSQPARAEPAAPRAARLLPAPWLSLGLLLLWLLLNRSVSLGTWLLGAALAAGLPLVLARLRPGPAVHLRRPRVALRLVGVVLRDMCTTSIAVAAGAVRGRAPQSRWVAVPLDLHDAHGLAALSIIMCLTPDTLWAGLSADGRRLTIHVFDLPDEAGYADQLKQRYERPLMEIFQR